MKRNILFSTTGWKSHLSREKEERIAADNTKEEKTNKVVTHRSNPDNNHYPSEKLLHDCLERTKAECNDRCNNEELRATNAEQEIIASLDTFQNIQVPFTYRPTGGDIPVADGIAKINNIKGYSVLWNQFARTAASQTTGNVSVQSNGDGSYNVQTLVDESAENDVTFAVSDTLVGCAGHKILFFGAPKGSSAASYCLLAEKSGLCDTSEGCIIESAPEGESFVIKISKGTNINSPQRFSPQIFDLTKMFGRGNEPSTLKAFRTLFPVPIYEYCYGKLLSFVGGEIKTTAFNQFNGKFASVLADVQYYLGGTYNSIGFSQLRNGDAIPFELPEERIYTPATNGFIHASGEDICINISNACHNGEYKDYIENFNLLLIESYFPDGMKSVGSVCDEITDEKVIIRIAARDYTNGDESDASVLTDGEKTYYVKETPSIITPAPDYSFITSRFGTEEIMCNTLSAPMRAEIAYPFNVKESIKENSNIIAALTKRIAELEAKLLQ